MSEIAYLISSEKRDAFTSEIILLIPEEYKKGQNHTPTWHSDSLFPAFDPSFIRSLPKEHRWAIQDAYKRIVID
ncbi:MAG: hypothetical protein AAB221_11080 [Bacteroidota bacterium]